MLQNVNPRGGLPPAAGAGTVAGIAMTGSPPREQDGTFSLLGDRPSARGADPLGFDKVAADLAGMVLASRDATPFTLGIEAEWGWARAR